MNENILALIEPFCWRKREWFFVHIGSLACARRMLNAQKLAQTSSFMSHLRPICADDNGLLTHRSDFSEHSSIRPLKSMKRMLIRISEFKEFHEKKSKVKFSIKRNE